MPNIHKVAYHPALRIITRQDTNIAQRFSTNPIRRQLRKDVIRTRPGNTNQARERRHQQHRLTRHRLARRFVLELSRLKLSQQELGLFFTMQRVVDTRVTPDEFRERKQRLRLLLRTMPVNQRVAKLLYDRTLAIRECMRRPTQVVGRRFKTRVPMMLISTLRNSQILFETPTAQ